MIMFMLFKYNYKYLYSVVVLSLKNMIIFLINILYVMYAEYVVLIQLLNFNDLVNIFCSLFI
jgi:hypothetical protein